MQEDEIQMMKDAIVKVTAEICKSKETAYQFLIDAGIYDSADDNSMVEESTFATE